MCEHHGMSGHRHTFGTESISDVTVVIVERCDCIPNVFENTKKPANQTLSRTSHAFSVIDL